MSDLTKDDLRLYAHLTGGYLDNETWAVIPVEMVAVELQISRESVTSSLARLLGHGSIECRKADIIRDGDVIDRGFKIYRLT